MGAIDKLNNRNMPSGTDDTLELASPHVAGVAALLIASGVTDNAEVRQILQETAEDLGSPGWDGLYGYGLVNAVRALSVALPAAEL